MSYKYSPLSESRSIRVVTLQPGIRHPSNKPETVYCELEHVRLADNPYFEALSYVWGDPTIRENIILGGSQFSITKNLHAALLRMRKEEISRTLWIDAICINQEDVDERSQQVALMGDIYRAASGAAVWLGEQSHLDKRSLALCLETLKKLSSGRLIELREQLTGGSLNDRAGTLVHDTLKEELKVFSSPFSKDAQVWKILRGFLCKDWFQRSWILQEVALSMHSTRVQCNAITIDFETLYQACITVEALGLAGSLASISNEDSLVIHMGRLQHCIRTDPSHAQLKLFSLLSSRRRCLATNPRDKVYALLGMVNDAGGISPDYSKSVEEIYMQTAKHIMITNKDLKLLSEVKELRPNPELPSWVPNWSISPKVTTLATRNSNGTRRYLAAGESSAKFTVSESGEKAIAIHGLCFDEISPHLGVVSSIADGSNYTPWLGLTAYSTGLWAELARSVFPEGVYTPTGEPLIQAYNRVLAADQSLISDRIDRDTKAAYFPQTINFISAVKSEIGHILYPQAIRQVKDLNIDLEAILGSYIKGPELYSTADVMEYLYKSPRVEGVPPEILGYVESELFSVNYAITEGRKIFISKSGHMGLCPEATEPDDIVCVLFGADVPFVLRPLQNGNHLLVGECYIDGFMDGEAILKAAISREGNEPYNLGRHTNDTAMTLSTSGDAAPATSSWTAVVSDQNDGQKKITVAEASDNEDSTTQSIHRKIYNLPARVFVIE